MNCVKNFFQQLNVLGQCKKYGISPWQCPQFLFLVLGIIIIISIVASYIVGSRYVEDPQLVALIVTVIAGILFIFSTVITNSFERVAEANRMKSEFISIVSHQLRSPLSSMKWSLEILLSRKFKDVPEKELSYLQILQESNSRMLELVSDLLAVSRIEYGKLLLHKKEVRLSEIIKEVMEELSIFAEASNVEMIFEDKDGSPLVFVDRSQIKMAVENLLDNAIRYSKNSERGKVVASLNRQGNTVVLSIKDSGVGVPQADQKHIFKKFFRSRNALRHKTEGSGLGLYIVKSIIEKSGGKIYFKSQEGVGSTFWITLPTK